MFSNVRYHREGAVGTITLDAPPMNLISKEMTVQLDQVLDACASDQQLRVLIITGAGGRAFCAGSDIKEFPAMMHPRAVIEEKLRFENQVYSKLAHFPAPTIASVNGVALGGGLELAVCCDFVIVETDTVLALPETRLGIFPGSGGTIRVPRRIGTARAQQMIFLGDPVPPQKALEWGLVDQVVEKGTLGQETRHLAQRLADCSKSALGLAKQALQAAEELTEQQAIDATLELMDQAFCSADAKKGVTAFIRKCKADFHKEEK